MFPNSSMPCYRIDVRNNRIFKEYSNSTLNVKTSNHVMLGYCVLPISEDVLYIDVLYSWKNCPGLAV